MLGMEMLDSDVTWPLGTSTRHTLAMVRTLEEQMYVSFEGCDRAAEERLTLERNSYVEQLWPRSWLCKKR